MALSALPTNRPSSRPADRLTPCSGKFESSLIRVDPQRLAKEGSRMIFTHPSDVPPRSFGVVTVVIDLDETLVFAREGTICIRPYVQDLLQGLASLVDHEGRRSVEVILWSAGDQSHVDRCLQILDPTFSTAATLDAPTNLIHYAICRGDWIVSVPALKDLDMLSTRTGGLPWMQLLAEAGVAVPGSPASSRDEKVPDAAASMLVRNRCQGGRFGTCVIIDDSPYATVCNGHAALIIPNFQPHHPDAASDTTLLYVLQVMGRVSHCLSHLARFQVASTLGNAGRRLELRAPAFRDAMKAIESGATREHALQIAETAIKEHIIFLETERYFRNRYEAADFMADHPFVVAQPVQTQSGMLYCLRLDVAAQDVVEVRVREFRARRRSTPVVAPSPATGVAATEES